jgi:hypothetical protein
MFLFLDYTRFGFELVNQKLFEMRIKKITHLIYLVIFHLKVIICQNVNLPHTYMVIAPRNTHLSYDNYQTFHMAQKHISIIWNHNV